jgi:hypothetical protein
MSQEVPNFENKDEIKELSAEQKHSLSESWCQLVVDNEVMPNNIDKLSQDEIREWLFKSIMRDTEKLAGEFGIQPNAVLIECIKTTKDMSERSSKELEYLKHSHSQVDDLVKSFDKSPNKSLRWDSWPKRMRETGEFNCVGATLFGMYMLEKAGIKSFLGNPYGHVINIVQLSNGDWWYADFVNGSQNLMKIDPEEIEIAGARVFKVKHPNIEYGLIPIFENSEIPGSVLENFSSMAYEANDSNIPDVNIGKIEAKEYLEKYGQHFKKADFSLLNKIIYTQKVGVSESDEMQKEKARISELCNFEESVRNYIDSLTKEQQEKIKKEAGENKKAIEKLLYEDSFDVLQKVGVELKKTLELYIEGLNTLKKYPESYQEALDNIIGRLREM